MPPEVAQYGLVGIAGAAFVAAWTWVQKEKAKTEQARRDIEAEIEAKCQAVKNELKVEIEGLRLRIRYLEHSDRTIRQMMITQAAELMDGASPIEVAKRLMAGATHYDEIKP